MKFLFLRLKCVSTTLAHCQTHRHPVRAMDCRVLTITMCPIPLERNCIRNGRLTLVVHSSTRRRQPKYIRYPRRTKSPPEFGVNLFLKKTGMNTKDPSLTDLIDNKESYFAEEEEEEDKEEQEQDDTEGGGGTYWCFLGFR